MTFFSQSPAFFSSANHQSIPEKTRLFQWVADVALAADGMYFIYAKYIVFIIQIWEVECQILDLVYLCVYE